MSAAPGAGLAEDFDKLSRLSEKEWLETLLRAYEPDSPPRGLLCGYPSAELQTGTVGCAGPAALTHAFRYWVDVRKICASRGRPLGPATHLLDFGCAWGRITRFFFKDTRPENVVGIDVDADFIALSRRIMSGGTYEVVAPLPPTALAPESLDLVIGYSVFSHLAEHAATAWMKEFARLLKPGGLVIVNTRPRAFFDYCESFARDPGATFMMQRLSRMFPDFDEARRRYDRGEFLYAPMGGGGARDASYYGEAFIPEGYARRGFSPDLEFREFRFDPARHELALIVLQKPDGNARS
jgi:SAM-dependent methyltransferase